MSLYIDLNVEKELISSYVINLIKSLKLSNDFELLQLFLLCIFLLILSLACYQHIQPF